MSGSLPTVGILGGTGKEGSGLALRWARNGYPLIIGSRSPERAAQAAQELRDKVPGANVRGAGNAEAARDGEIVVLTVPYEAQMSTLADVKDQLKGKVLVDATARVDWRKPRPPQGKAAPRIAQELLGPEVRVVAAGRSVGGGGGVRVVCGGFWRRLYFLRKRLKNPTSGAWGGRV